MTRKVKLIFATMICCSVLVSLLSEKTYVEAKKIIADVKTSVMTANEEISSTNYDSWGYSAKVSPISQFYDNLGRLNVVYDGASSFYIAILNSNREIIKNIEITKKYPLLGGVAHWEGYYYAVYGNTNKTEDANQVVMSVAKYDGEGIYVDSVEYKGNETCPYSGDSWGTKIPFDAGNCSIAIQNGVLICSYAREMYSGHQSNHVLYVDIDQMEALPTAPCYTSHSFDQRVIATSDGAYLFVDHGDAYGRGFTISRVVAGSTNIWENEELTSFHFREGSNRSHGYNETYAQLGGIAECSTGYVLAGSSEKTLSLEVAPTNTNYCGHSEARNLFVQILKKDFYLYRDADCYAVGGSERKATGTPTKNAATKLFLDESVVDYGVIWLTDYSKEYYCASPKVVVTDEDHIVLLWEKLKYEDDSLVDSYMMILDSKGQVLQKETSLGGIRLDANEDVLYSKDSILWTTNPGDYTSTTLQIHELMLGNYVEQKSLKNLTFGKVTNKTYSTNGENLSFSIKDGDKTLIKNIDYTVSMAEDYFTAGKWKITIEGKGYYTGSKTMTVVVKPSKPTISSIQSKTKGILKAEVDSYCGEEGIQWQYSTSKDFKTNVKKYDGWSYFNKSGLSSGKTYYLRARGYVVVDTKRVYSAYSDIAKIKIK